MRNKTRDFRGFLIAAISLAVYANALFNGFVYDDNDQILNNPWIRDIRRIPDIFTKQVWSFTGLSKGNYYRPLMHVAYMADYHVFGLSPWGYRLVNMVLNAGVSVLVYLLAKRLWAGRGPRSAVLFTIPFIAAVLFAVTPIHTEAVSWIASFPEVSFTFFYLLSLLFYMKAVEDKVKGAHALSVASFFISSLCKETALTLPLVIMCYEHFLRRAKERPLKYIRRYAPFFFAAAIYFAARYHALGGLAPGKRHVVLTGYGYFINIFPLFAGYLLKLIFPVNLNAYHILHPISSLAGARGTVSLSITVIFAGLALIAFRKDRTIFLCMSVIAIPLLPVLYIPGASESAFAERYLYLPSCGFAMIAAFAVSRLANRPSRAAAAGMVFVLTAGLYCAGTISRNTVWRDDYTFWTETVRKSPDGAAAHINLGCAYRDKGLIDKAVEEYRTAIRLDPDRAGAYNNLGEAYRTEGLVDQAMEEYRTALKLDPDFVEAHNNLGEAYRKKGLVDRAVEEYRAAIKLNPDHANAHNNLGNAYLNEGLFDQAVDEYRTAIKINPGLAEAHYNLGLAYSNKGLVDRAMEEYQAVLRLNPSLAPAMLPWIQAAQRK